MDRRHKSDGRRGRQYTTLETKKLNSDSVRNDSGFNSRQGLFSSILCLLIATTQNNLAKYTMKDGDKSVFVFAAECMDYVPPEYSAGLVIGK